MTAELRETHISWVVLEGDRAYKIKKPVRLPFLDYGSLDRRHELCREEVRLNRRLAPDVYLGVCALVPDAGGVRPAHEAAAGAVEYAVVIRRYEEGQTLARGAAREAEVRAVGRRLAAFHAAAARPPDAERSVDALERMLSENVATLRELEADRATVDDAERLVDAVLAGRRRELLARARAAWSATGHGDLRAEHVVLERDRRRPPDAASGRRSTPPTSACALTKRPTPSSRPSATSSTVDSAGNYGVGRGSERMEPESAHRTVAAWL